MKAKFFGGKWNWWPNHERYCNTQFACNKGRCRQLGKEQQRHVVICSRHAKDNAHRENDFIQQLDPHELPTCFGVKTTAEYGLQYNSTPSPPTPATQLSVYTLLSRKLSPAMGRRMDSRNRVWNLVAKLSPYFM